MKMFYIALILAFLISPSILFAGTLKQEKSNHGVFAAHFMDMKEIMGGVEVTFQVHCRSSGKHAVNGGATFRTYYHDKNDEVKYKDVDATCYASSTSTEVGSPIMFFIDGVKIGEYGSKFDFSAAIWIKEERDGGMQ